MKIPTEAKVRDELLRKYREAVAYQIGVWEAAILITKTLECDLELVLNQVSTAAALADTGMELTEVDLNDLFGIVGRVVIGHPGPSRKQIH